MEDSDIIDCMEWAETKLTDEQKKKVDAAQLEITKSGKPYFCGNTNLIKQLFGLTLKDGEAFNTASGLMVVCNSNIKDYAFFTNLDITEEELNELRNDKKE